MNRAAHPAPASARGRLAEAAAGDYLAARGYRVVGRNLRRGRGELDLVAWDGGILVFVEVRGRAPGACALPEETVDPRKRARLVSAAEAYLAGLDAAPPCRFDLVAVELGELLPGAPPARSFRGATGPVLRGWPLGNWGTSPPARDWRGGPVAARLTGAVLS